MLDKATLFDRDCGKVSSNSFGTSYGVRPSCLSHVLSSYRQSGAGENESETVPAADDDPRGTAQLVDVSVCSVHNQWGRTSYCSSSMLLSLLVKANEFREQWQSLLGERCSSPELG